MSCDHSPPRGGHRGVAIHTRLAGTLIGLGALAAAAGAGPTIDVEDHFIIAPNSTWHYTGAGQEGSTQEDDFSWTVLPDLKAVHGVMATQIQTLTDEPSDDRNMDRDYWSIDSSGALFFHGFFNGQEDGSGLTAFPVQDVILDEAFLAGTRGMVLPAVFSDMVTASGISLGPFSGLTANLQITVEHRGLAPIVKTPVGEFLHVLHTLVSLTVVSVETPLGTVPVNLDYRASEFYFAEDVGMVLQDQDADPDDAQVQALDSGTVAGAPVVPDAPPNGTFDAILNFLLGFSEVETGLDLNADGGVDIADIVTHIEGPGDP